MTTFLWCLTAVSAYIAGVLSIKTSLQVTYWRRLKRERPISSAARRENAERGVKLTIWYVLWCVATMGLGLLATFGGGS